MATYTYTYLRYVDPDISGVIWMLLYSVAIYILIEGLLYLLRTVLAITFGVADVIFSMPIKMLDLAPVQMPSWASRLSWLAYGKGILSLLKYAGSQSRDGDDGCLAPASEGFTARCAVSNF